MFIKRCLNCPLTSSFNELVAVVGVDVVVFNLAQNLCQSTHRAFQSATRNSRKVGDLAQLTHIQDLQQLLKNYKLDFCKMWLFKFHRCQEFEFGPKSES